MTANDPDRSALDFTWKDRKVISQCADIADRYSYEAAQAIRRVFALGPCPKILHQMM